MSKALMSSMIMSCVLVVSSCAKEEETSSVEAEAVQPQMAEATEPVCSMSSQGLANWFADGAVSQNGLVKPADSTAFPPVQNTTCDFYKWASQMFLWLTSPTGGSYIFDGDFFYDVVATDGGYQFVSNLSNAPNQFSLRSVKPIDAGSTGQAGGSGVLISQGGSLTYYGMHANDVYANYLTGQKAGQYAGTDLASTFPTSADDVALVEKTSGILFPDAVAAVMELKTSWVDISTVKNPENYITIQAMVPSYDESDPQKWTYEGVAEQKTLALVGMHIVGAVDGHPELVWASFEHLRNAPDLTYYYTAPDGASYQVPYDSSGTWTYMQTGAAAITDIVETANVDGNGNIVAATSQTISATNVARLNPWGSAPNTQDSGVNNGQLLELNQTIVSQLAKVGDVRAHYVQIGGIWSQLGQIPTSGTDDFLRGSLLLANATMETFHQYPDKHGFVSNNCFTCHNSGSDTSIDVSHIFGALKPLGGE